MKQLVKMIGLAAAALVFASLLYPAVGALQEKGEKGKDKGKEKKEKVYEVGADGLKIEGKLADTDPKDTVKKESYCKIYLIKLAKGTKYEIRMNAANMDVLDSYLRIEDAKGKQVAENDDAPGEETLNSRVDFKCGDDGVYRIIATSFRPDDKGDFTILVKVAK